MIQRTPELVHSAPTEVHRTDANGTGSFSNRSSIVGLATPSPDGSSTGPHSGDEDITEHAFVFVPPDPKFYYKRLFEIALDHDYEAMKDLPPDEDVSLTILSPTHEALLRDCETRWRIVAPLRASTFLALICQHYKHQEVPEACVVEAMSGLERVADVWSYWRWPWADVCYVLARVLTKKLIRSSFSGNTCSKTSQLSSTSSSLASSRSFKASSTSLSTKSSTFSRRSTRARSSRRISPTSASLLTSSSRG